MAFLVNRAKLPTHVVYAAAQCLYVLSEDNPPAIQSIRSESEYIACLVAISTAHQAPNDDERDVGIRVLSCGGFTRLANVFKVDVWAIGTLRNISPLPAAMNASSIDIDRAIALPLITPILSYSVQDAVTEVQSTLAEPPAPLPNPSLKHAKLPKSDHKTPAEVVLERVERRLRIMQLALEILTGVCAQMPDPEPVEEDMVEEEMDEMEDDEGIIENGVTDDDAMDADASIDGPPEADSSSVSLLRTLTPLLLALSTPTTMSFPPPTTSPANTTAIVTPTSNVSSSALQHPPTTSALVAVHLSALECLSNLLLSFPASDSGPVNPAVRDVAVAAWSQAWPALRTVLSAAPSNSDRRAEVSIAALGALWGLARLARGVVVPVREHVETLVQIADSPGAEVQAQVKCVGILGSLAQNVDEVEMNKAIAQYLLSYIHPTPRAAEPTLHALSLLIDIYADEANPYDINFRNAHGTDVLASSIATLRKLVRGIDRRKEGGVELRRWADEVESNVRGFITYRRKLKI
ncbi:hypothetical protein FRC10_009456 [Ceratobasidium sp. 414]|nr:hypothetical protein FRC10_009456 [Ceratobasidium sp. 414]